MDNRTDVCPICEEFQDKVKTRFNTEAERLKIAQDLTDHLHGAQTERDFYKQQCKKATDELQDHQKVQNPGPCSQNLYYVHYTFDFANSVLVPSHVRQEGPLYYKSPLKCMWFGVCNDGRNEQTNYIYSEENCIGTDGAQGHSSNAVISMLDHYFAYLSEGEKRCCLNADNCGGQNKNQIMTGYLSWRILSGLHEEIYLHFMKPYHARCLVDGMFGLGRKSLRRHDIDCVSDVSNVIAKSTKYASVVQYDTGGQNTSWIWRDWKTFLKALFRPVPQIQNYQHFRFTSLHPGSVFVRENVHSVEKEICLLKKRKHVEVGMLPPRLEYGGLSAKRAWYLYDNLRQFVHIPHKDTTCPRPSVPKPSHEE